MQVLHLDGKAKEAATFSVQCQQMQAALRNATAAVAFARDQHSRAAELQYEADAKDRKAAKHASDGAAAHEKAKVR